MRTTERPRSSAERRRGHASTCVAALAALAACALGCTKSGELTSRTSSATPLACVAPASDAERDLACARWACARAELTPAAWDGDATTCAPGAIDLRARERALAVVNVYRALAGVHAVEPEPRWDGPAQDCALLAHANRELSHAPPRDWSCWSERAARASAVSLVANRSAPLAIDPFIEDLGNEPTMVHRRWLLSEKVRRLGLGSTSGFACALVDGRAWDAPAKTDERASVGEPDAGDAALQRRALAAPPAWVAWPPPGHVPVEALERTSVDRAGWTIQSSSLDLDGARVEVRVLGEARRIAVHPLERAMGSLTAIRFVPEGWSVEPDLRYDVRVVKGDVVIGYAVEPIDCP